MKKLTTTSYALLGLLARQPSSAYELNKNMQNTVARAFWPRTEGHVYSELKNLAEHKLASVKEETKAGRKRAVYSVTATGRSKLKSWIAADSSQEWKMESELMLKFLFADSGEAQSLRANLDAVIDSTRSDIHFLLQGLEAAMAEGSNRDGMPYNGLSVELLLELLESRLDWATACRKKIEGLSQTNKNEATSEMGVEVYAKLLPRAKKLVKKADGL